MLRRVRRARRQGLHRYAVFALVVIQSPARTHNCFGDIGGARNDYERKRDYRHEGEIDEKDRNITE